jgi:hypothetical protein
LPAAAAPGVSFGFACAFLWAFLWRSFLTTLPLWPLGPMAIYALLPVDLLSDPVAMLQPENVAGMIGRLLLVSIVLSLISLLLMAVAMRWTLRDFQRRLPQPPPAMPPPGAHPEVPHIMD